jgi:hypothetical protein
MVLYTSQEQKKTVLNHPATDDRIRTRTQKHLISCRKQECFTTAFTATPYPNVSQKGKFALPPCHIGLNEQGIIHGFFLRMELVLGIYG